MEKHNDIDSISIVAALLSGIAISGTLPVRLHDNYVSPCLNARKMFDQYPPFKKMMKADVKGEIKFHEFPIGGVGPETIFFVFGAKYTDFSKARKSFFEKAVYPALQSLPETSQTRVRNDCTFLENPTSHDSLTIMESDWDEFSLAVDTRMIFLRDSFPYVSLCPFLICLIISFSWLVNHPIMLLSL